jgi:hypothetical protein
MDAAKPSGFVAPQYQANRLHLTDCRATDTVKGRNLFREPSVPHCSLILFTRFNFIEEIAMSDAALNQEKEQLLDDVRQVLSSTEDLLGAAGDEGGEKGANCASVWQKTSVWPSLACWRRKKWLSARPR